jgi:hypothetical protein
VLVDSAGLSVKVCRMGSPTVMVQAASVVDFVKSEDALAGAAQHGELADGVGDACDEDVAAGLLRLAAEEMDIAAAVSVPAPAAAVVAAIAREVLAVGC